jgi:hypothetical protein
VWLHTLETAGGYAMTDPRYEAYKTLCYFSLARGAEALAKLAVLAFAWWVLT